MTRGYPVKSVRSAIRAARQASYEMVEFSFGPPARLGSGSKLGGHPRKTKRLQTLAIKTAKAEVSRLACLANRKDF